MKKKLHEKKKQINNMCQLVLLFTGLFFVTRIKISQEMTQICGAVGLAVQHIRLLQLEHCACIVVLVIDCFLI